MTKSKYRKYILLPKRKDGLRRIKYKIDIPRLGVKAGDLGGYLEGYHNLSQKEDCCVLDNARVYCNAYVYGNACVCNDAFVHDNAVIRDNAFVHGNARVHDNARARGNASIGGNARICANANMYDCASVSCGRFDHSPPYVGGCAFPINADGYGLIRVGCHRHTYEWWLVHGPAIAKIEDLSKKDTEEIRRAITFVHNEMEARK